VVERNQASKIYQGYEFAVRRHIARYFSRKKLRSLTVRDVRLMCQHLAAGGLQHRGDLLLKAPKTRKSRRTVPLPAPVVEALRAHKAAQARERLAAGATWHDSEMVFTSRVGTPMEPDNLRRSWYRVRAVLPEPRPRFHDLRHTCVTLLLTEGVPPHIVQEIVGHSAIDVTMTIYAHTSLDEKRKALRLLGERLG
jgi:integrase